MPKRRGPSLRFAVVVVSALALLTIAFAGCSKQGGSNLTGTMNVSGDRVSHVLLARNAADIGATMKIQNAHTPELMGIAGVIGTGTGATADGRAAVLVLTSAEGVRGIPSSIDGVPVEVRVVGDVHAYARPGGGGPIECGTSTGRDDECAAGTIGCVVNKGGSQYFLSNNHVFAAENAGHVGDRIDAPGRYDGKPKCAQTPQLGTLSDFQTINFGKGTTNVIDCAIAAPAAGVSYTTAEEGGFTPTSTVVAAFVGQAVKKDGRTSGLTHGNVTGVNVTITVGYSTGNAVFVNQIMMNSQLIRSGDSGSLLVEETTNNPVGLCFAGGTGGTFANPIGPVLQKFGATVAQ
jgi:hypothetical protein